MKTTIFSKKKSFRISLLAGFLIVLLAGISFAEDKYLVGNLKPGPYAVGFKAVHTYDYTETWAPKYDEKGNVLRDENPRPMQIAIWYPAEDTSHAERVLFRDYIHLDATRVNFKELTETDKQTLDQAFMNQQLFTGTANKELMSQYLKLKTTAFNGARGMGGKFPLIIYAPREYRGAYLNSVLCEYLASHGYIVASTPNKDRQNHITQSQPDADILDAYLGDLKFVKSYMREFPNVDMNKVGTVGYWVGSAPALLFAMRDPNVRALVSFDGAIGASFVQPILKLNTVPNFDLRNLRIPILHVTPAVDGQGNPSAFANEDKFLYADRYVMKIKGGTNIGFSSYFNLAWMKSVENPGRFNYEEIDEAYDIACERTRTFLNAILKGDTHAIANLERSSNENVEVSVAKGFEAPPTQSQFANTFLTEGPDAAWKIFRKVKKNDPSYQIFSANAMNQAGYGLINLGKTAEAVEAMKMYTEAYPNDPNAFDSLGEVYLANGEKENAIASFKKSLSMNPPQNVKANSIQLLREIGVVVDDGNGSAKDVEITFAARKADELYPNAPKFDDPTRVSKNKEVAQRIADAEIKIEYGSPSVRNRKVLGGLVSTYRVWRTGANEATIITFDKDVKIEGKPLQAGSYSLFTVGGSEEWTLIFNKVNQQWGAFTYDGTQDALRVAVKPDVSEHQEEMEFEFTEVNGKACQAVLRWEKIAVQFNIEIASN